jgi:3D (Asp-Asp-Asp) domain-containing protein
MRRIRLLLVLFFFSFSAFLAAQDLACSGMSLGIGASLNGFIPFPADNAWNQDISNSPVDPNSSAIISFIGDTTPLHPDFGAGLYDGSSIGIPYDIVSGSPFVSIDYTAYGSQSDRGPMPIPKNAPIEGYPNPGSGDRHVLVLDRDNCWLYELYSSYPQKNGTWDAGSGAVWDLLNDEQRPYTWTSADAAGLSVFAGLARYDEVASGEIQHALRFTVPYTESAITPPATHWAGTSSNAYAPPMGMRMRLQASYDISSFPPQSQVILAALQKYGMILADNGSAIYITGDPDSRWDNDDLASLKTVPASAFDVILISPLYTASDVPTGPAPTISSFTADPTVVSAGQTVTLSWNASGASYFVVSPQVGAVRGNSVSVTPKATTTYTLYGTNAYGRSTANVKVTVQ